MRTISDESTTCGAGEAGALAEMRKELSCRGPEGTKVPPGDGAPSEAPWRSVHGHSKAIIFQNAAPRAHAGARGTEDCSCVLTTSCPSSPSMAAVPLNLNSADDAMSPDVW